MINTANSAHLLARFEELISKGSFDMTALKKGRLPDHVFSRWKWFYSLSYWMLNRGLSAA